MNRALLEIDGALGEGGGQVLRTALSLSAVTGRTFSLINIRKKRSKPGLMNQHLACVKAAAAVCNAEVEGAHRGSESLTFQPGLVRSGNYAFDLHGAGSTMLVFQTLMPILSSAGAESELELTGGTHNPWAPPFEFVERVFLPAVEELGFKVKIELIRHGFYPRGGGLVKVRIAPRSPHGRLSIIDRGSLREMRPLVLIADLDSEIAKREARILGRALKRSSLPADIRRAPPGEGPGNAVLLEAGYSKARCLFSAFGRKGQRAEAVAQGPVAAWQAFHQLEVPVQAELADQLLLPMALAGNGEFITGPLSSHVKTNIQVIEQFMELSFKKIQTQKGATKISI
ncbi:MAG: RNA 3'-terminal phosphate cyclase [Planctomycetes bacterium]|nr:RNA 3'-terminal phosphate cyclase [Planctomycetota bacterium]